MSVMALARQLVPVAFGAGRVAAGFGALLGALSAVAGLGAAGLAVAGFGAGLLRAAGLEAAAGFGAAVFAGGTVFLAAAVASFLVASFQARLPLAGISGSVTASRSSANLRWLASRCSAKS